MTGASYLEPGGMPVIDGHNDLPMQLRARYGYRVEGLDQRRARPSAQRPRRGADPAAGQR